MCTCHVSRVRISWDIRQVLHRHCVSFFLLKYWHSSDFVPRYTTLKFAVSGARRMFAGAVKVKPCTTYSYILSMAYAGSKTVDIQGDDFYRCRLVYILTFYIRRFENPL